MAGEVVPLGPRRVHAATAELGFAIFLCSWSLLVGLFTLQVALRSSAGSGGAAGGGSGAAAAASLLVASSVSLHAGWWRVRRGVARRLGGWLVAAGLLGVAFLAVEAGAWGRAGAGGRFLTALVAVHVMGGLAALAWLAVGERRGILMPAHRTRARLVGIYWHAVVAFGVVVSAVA